MFPRLGMLFFSALLYWLISFAAYICKRHAIFLGIVIMVDIFCSVSLQTTCRPWTSLIYFVKMMQGSSRGWAGLISQPLRSMLSAQTFMFWSHFVAPPRRRTRIWAWWWSGGHLKLVNQYPRDIFNKYQEGGQRFLSVLWSIWIIHYIFIRWL